MQSEGSSRGILQVSVNWVFWTKAVFPQAHDWIITGNHIAVGRTNCQIITVFRDYWMITGTSNANRIWFYFFARLHGITARNDCNCRVNDNIAAIAKKEDLVWDQFRSYNKFIPVQNMTEKLAFMFGLAFVQLTNAVSTIIKNMETR